MTRGVAEMGRPRASALRVHTLAAGIELSLRVLSKEGRYLTNWKAGVAGCNPLICTRPFPPE